MTDRPADRLVSPHARASARKRANTDAETRRETAPERDPPEAGQSGRDPPATREQWIAYHVARAPKITPRQWADMLLLLQTRNPENDNENQKKKKAS